MTGTDDIQRVAAALERPRTGYLDRLEETRLTIVVRSGEASRQLGVFIDRVGDLTLDELCELYDETYRADQSTIGPLVSRLVQERTSEADAATALAALAPLLDRLDADRNPHAYVVRSLCCLLLRRVDPAAAENALA